MQRKCRGEVTFCRPWSNNLLRLETDSGARGGPPIGRPFAHGNDCLVKPLRWQLATSAIESVLSEAVGELGSRRTTHVYTQEIPANTRRNNRYRRTCRSRSGRLTGTNQSVRTGRAPRVQAVRTESPVCAESPEGRQPMRAGRQGEESVRCKSLRTAEEVAQTHLYSFCLMAGERVARSPAFNHASSSATP